MRTLYTILGSSCLSNTPLLSLPPTFFTPTVITIVLIVFPQRYSVRGYVGPEGDIEEKHYSAAG